MARLSRPAFSSTHLLCASFLASLLLAQACMADTPAPPTLALGVGVNRMPGWSGAKTMRTQPIPYVDIEIPDRMSLSTQDGLQVDLISHASLHGGIYGNYLWGRESDELGVLRHKVDTLPPRFTLGGYLEWQLGKQIDVGSDLSHDINGAGAYFRLYADWSLPPVGPLRHSLQLSWQAMNAAAMHRFFGISPAQANALQVSPWQPGAGSQFAALEYDLFLPTSKHTGFALALAYGRLLGAAGNSPLVTHFGSRSQWNESIAFIYHR